MQSLQLFFYNFVLAQMIMSTIILLPQWNKNQSIRLYILLMISSSGYLLGEIYAPSSVDSLARWFELIGGNALPGLFWLVSLSVFGDHVILKRWQYIIASLTLFVPLTKEITQVLWSYQLSDYQAFYGFVKYSSMLLELVLIAHALVIAAQQWRDDLVQDRRYIRGGFITFSAMYLFLVIVMNDILTLEWLWLDLMKSLLLAILIAGTNFLLFRLREASLFEVVKTKVTPVAEVKAPSKALSKVIASMVEDKLYQQDGMTISSLAKHLCIHEYKLRHLINGELNYRNFNDFLNYYRIKEVTEKLGQNEYSGVPVLTLALESGFRSLSSFNKVFKSTHHATPTEYRKKILAQTL